MLQLKHSNKKDYRNAAVEDENLESAKMNTLTPIYFSMMPTDFDQPWFHKEATRTFIEEKLKFCEWGTFVVRPSTSYGGCYALSWVNEGREVEHQVVYNLFPGYSLKQRPEEEKEIFRSLTELVEQTHYLKSYLPSNVELDPDLLEKTIEQTSTDIVNSMTNKLIDNELTFTQLDWTITLVEFSTKDISLKLAHCEARTCLRFSSVEYVAPRVYKLDVTNAQLIADAISKNQTLRSLKITGYPGYMRRNFTPNITDSELEILIPALEKNTMITSIDLSHNQITNYGAKLIARLLLNNPFLKKINLDHNFITQEGIISIAHNLQQNKTLERLSLFNQLQKQLNNSIVLTSSPFDRFLLRLIDDSLKRRSELLTSPLPSYQGFLTHNQAEHKLLSISTRPPLLSNNNSNHPPVTNNNTSSAAVEKPYLFYLHPNAPNRIYICHTTISNGYQDSASSKVIFYHQPIYRTLYGYSLNRSLETHTLDEKTGKAKAVTVPSLLDHCLWLIYGKGLLKKEKEDSVPPELREKIEDIKNLSNLWRLVDIPCPKWFMDKPIRQVGASTLSQFISRNKNIFSNNNHNTTTTTNTSNIKNQHHHS